jgi:uncharacterized RDD family membrane protein YckC
MSPHAYDSVPAALGRSLGALMERSLDVRTPESIAITYELAGLGSRFLAVFVDFVIQIVILIVATTIIAAIGGRHAGLKVASYPQAWLIAIYVFLTFLNFFGYFIIFEWWWRGQTPGKKAVGIRVVRDGGFPVDFITVTIRNVIRAIEFGLGFYLISAISTLVSKENKRLGDFAAGTIVVREGKRAARGYHPQENDARLDRDERALVERYVERRAMLSGSARKRIAMELAQRLRPKFPEPALAQLDDDGFLLRIATRT